MEDSQIIDLYWQRSSDAITESNAKYGGYCHAIALRILGSRLDAEECVNDTWVGAWNAMPVHRPACLSAFLGKLTRRAACNRLEALRAEKRGGGELPLVLEELSDCVPAPSDPARAVEDGELAREVNPFLRRLPEQACGVFRRRYWYAEPLADIAARYGMSEDAVIGGAVEYPEDITVSSIDYTTDNDRAPASAVVSVRYRPGTEDSFDYLTLELKRTEDRWLAVWAGTEK